MDWIIKEPKKAIEWKIQPGTEHTDAIEMSGYGCSFYVIYGIRNGRLILQGETVFPTMRRRPNETEASCRFCWGRGDMPALLSDGEEITEVPVWVRFDGVLSVETKADTLSVLHELYPSSDKRASYERVTVINNGNKPVSLTARGDSEKRIGRERGPMGVCLCELRCDFRQGTLQPGESTTYAVCISGRHAHEPVVPSEAESELLARRNTVARLTSPMKLDTGDPVLDTMFAMAKLRAGESVFRTRFAYGQMHSPGGLRFYAATWCNDQAEYSGPYFAYTGDPELRLAAMNGYRMYMPYMDEEYEDLPCSIIAECTDIWWCSFGDRGDGAMYLYGASRYALSCGDEASARELLPAIRWCAEYCRRKMTEDGAVRSGCDELEGRLPRGEANLCTTCLAYAGYRAAAILVRELESDTETAALYQSLADKIEKSLETRFGKTIHGLETYGYYKECEVFRSWMCMPLAVGIDKRAEATVKALTSPYLMTERGIRTSEEQDVFWDRALLYAIRGMFATGQTKAGMECLKHYNERRLLGDHVPYAVETDGGHQLSGESALYCKVVLEGMLYITPAGMHSFTICPTLPDELDHITLTDIAAYGAVFSVFVTRDGFRVVRSDGKLLAEGRLGEEKTVSVL